MFSLAKILLLVDFFHPAIRFRTVVAALDLGDHSEKVLCWAAQTGTRLFIAHATPSLEAGEYFDPNWRDYFAKQAEERISAILWKLGAQGDVWVESGDVPLVMRAAANHFRSDVMVIGRGSAAGVFGRLRANAYSIIRDAPMPSGECGISCA